MKRFQGQVAIVTGAARGIGAATAHRLADEGAAVVVADVLDAEGTRVANDIRRREGRAIFEHLDVTSEGEWRRAVDRAASLGRLSVLVNNAGIARNEDLEQETPEGYAQLIAVNQTGIWLGMRAVAAELKKHGGAIVNVSSIHGAAGGSGDSFASHASSGAIRQMTRSAAIHWAKDRIRVNSVHPGFVDVPMIAPLTTPMGRSGRPEEIAATIAFLASSDASYMTGAELLVDGGFSAW